MKFKIHCFNLTYLHDLDIEPGSDESSFELFLDTNNRLFDKGFGNGNSNYTMDWIDHIWNNYIED